MGQYVNIYMSVTMYRSIIDALMEYTEDLDEFFEIEDAIHMIDALEELYSEDMGKQNKGFIQWQNRQKLFKEKFKTGEGIFEQMNYYKVNNIIEKYKEEEELSMPDEEEQFNMILDILELFKEDEDENKNNEH